MEDNKKIDSLNDFDEDEFMLNVPSMDDGNNDIFDEILKLTPVDDVVDSISEQDIITEVELEDIKKDDTIKIKDEILDPYIIEEKKEEKKQEQEKEELIKDIKGDTINDGKSDEEVLIIDDDEDKILDEAMDNINDNTHDLPIVSEESIDEFYNKIEQPIKEEENEETKEEEKPKKKKKEKKKKKKISKGAFIAMLIFNIISITFILGCCGFYGTRLVKYYKVYNPKSDDGEKIELLGSSITSSASIATEGSGLYKSGSAYTYRGKDVNNYLEYKGLKFRITRVLADGSVEAILDSPINNMKFASKKGTYDTSDVNKYINDVFLKYLDKNDLQNVSVCLDTVKDIKNATCEKTYDKDYVRLLSVTEYANSKESGESYIKEENNIWLYNVGTKGAWKTYNGSLTDVDVTTGNDVLPLIKFKNSVVLAGGKGTSKDPYKIGKDNGITIGDYVKLGTDKWIVSAVESDNVRLALAGTLPSTYRFDTSSNLYNTTSAAGVGKYLNTTIMNKLSYKSNLENTTFNIGAVNTSYTDVTSKTVSAKLGLLSYSDIKLNNLDDAYYLLTPEKTGYEYVINSGLTTSKVNLARGVKPVITIKKNLLTTGEGTKDSPYEVGGSK